MHFFVFVIAVVHQDDMAADVEMTQNQVYGVSIAKDTSTGGQQAADNITMETNEGYGVGRAKQPRAEDESYEYI